MLLALALLQAWLACAWATPMLRLTPGTSEVNLAPFTTHMRDADGTLTLDGAVARHAQGAFEPLPGGKTAFGFRDGAFWFHVALVNQHPQEPRWLLLKEYALSDYVDVWVRQRDGSVQHMASGDARAFESRSIKYRHPNFLLTIPQGAPVDLFVRVQSQSSMQVPLFLYTPTAFTELSRDAQLSIGLYYGILLALFVYNLVLWLTTRDASYAWYLLHIGAFGLVLFTLNGLGYEYLWPHSPWFADKSVPVTICLALVGMQQFARTFLELPQRWPAGNRVSLALIAFFVLFGIASFQLDYSTSVPVATRAVLLGVAWVVVATVVVLRRGYQPAKLFLLAWAMLLLGTFVFSLLAFGLVPKTFYTEYGVQIGSALEMLLLSIALGYRYASLRAENQRVVSAANVKLGREVAARTRELTSTLAQLNDAHGRLRDTSRRDALTGLYNRSYFREALEDMLEREDAADRPVSLLMVDLDHFKAINDRHGHLAGDDCLRAAAHRLGSVLRAHDALLARFGGEEFIVALAGRGLGEALEVAESVRRRLNEDPCETRGVRVPVTASIGAHVVGREGDLATRIDVALQGADMALYAAKAAGRNRVFPATATA